MRKPEAYFFAEGEGMSSYHCSTKEQALESFKKLWADDPEGFEREYGKQEISLERIKEVRYYTHKKCGSMTFGEQLCYECGEPCGTSGRKTFMIEFVGEISNNK